MLVLISWLQDKSHFNPRVGFFRCRFRHATRAGSGPDGAGQIRPDGEGPVGDLAEAGAVGLPDLMAAITTAQAKNSRSKS